MRSAAESSRSAQRSDIHLKIRAALNGQPMASESAFKWVRALLCCNSSRDFGFHAVRKRLCNSQGTEASSPPSVTAECQCRDLSPPSPLFRGNKNLPGNVCQDRAGCAGKGIHTQRVALPLKQRSVGNTKGKKAFRKL